MKKSILFIFLFLLILCSQVLGLNYYWRSCLSGVGCLDAIDGTGLTAGDTAWVPYNNSGTAEGYRYLVIDDSAASNPPLVIVPSSNPGTHRWHLVQEKGAAFSVPKTSGTAGSMGVYEANSTDTDMVGWQGPSSITETWWYTFSSTQPTAGQAMVFAVPTGTGGPGSTKTSAQTWVTPVIEGGSGHGGLIFGDSGPDAAGEIGYDGALKYYNTAVRTVVSTDETQTLTNKSITAVEVDGHTTSTDLTAAQVSGTVITNYDQAASDVFLILPAAAAGYSALFTVATAQSNHWCVEAQATDKIYLVAAAGTITAGDDGAAVCMIAAQVGQSFACWTFKTGASAWDWSCKAIAIGTSTFEAHASSE